MEVTDVRRRRERKKRGRRGGKRDLDGPISRFTILMCMVVFTQMSFLVLL